MPDQQRLGRKFRNRKPVFRLEIENSKIFVLLGKNEEHIFFPDLTRGTTLPLSWTKTSFAQWRGTSNVDNFLLKAQTNTHIYLYTPPLFVLATPLSKLQ